MHSASPLPFRKLFFVLFFALSCLLAASALFAWTGPPSPPPNGNVPAPLNVGTSDQIKNGGISVNALAVFGSEYVEDKLGIGRTAPVVPLDINGTIRIGNSNEVCQGITAGAMRYNVTSNTIEYCDASIWKSIGAGAFAVSDIQSSSYSGGAKPLPSPLQSVTVTTTASQKVFLVGSAEVFGGNTNVLLKRGASCSTTTVLTNGYNYVQQSWETVPVSYVDAPGDGTWTYLLCADAGTEYAGGTLTALVL